jgi:hypothetical protein
MVIGAEEVLIREESALHFEASDLRSMQPCMGMASKTPISINARVAAMVYACKVSVTFVTQVKFGIQVRFLTLTTWSMMASKGFWI